MRYLTLAALALVSIPLHAQTNQADLYAMESSTVHAELSSKIDTKTAKPGDPVLTQTTRDTRISDGSRLPQGTKLSGRITEVRAKSDADMSAHLAVVLDRATLRNGTEVHLHVTLIAIAAPSVAGSVMSDPVPDASLSGGTTGTRSSSSASRTGGAATAGSGKSTGRGGGDPLNSLPDSIERSKPVANAGESANSAAVLRLRHVPVANLPGVILSSAVTSGTSGFLDATDRNIVLAVGTQLTLNVIAAAQ